MNLPDKFVSKMRRLLGDEFDEYLASFEKNRLYGLRVNTSKISVEEFKRICPFPIEQIPWIHNGFYYDGDKMAAAKHPYYFAGLYYLQEPSAMTPAECLPVSPGERVLDICAAPGGKATELGSKLCAEGLLVANDISASRAKGLLKNIEVFGITNAMVTCEDVGRLSGYFHEYFDKILIDAPCSGEGMFRKDRKMIKAWEEHGPEYFTGIQKNILSKAAGMLRPGGMMLYSTCTFDLEEDEEAAEYLLHAFPEFTICRISPYEGFAYGKWELTKSKNPALKDAVRIWPHRMGGEGHFLALLKKGGNMQSPERVKPGAGKDIQRKIPKEAGLFFEDIRRKFDPLRIRINGDKIYYVPEDLPDTPGIRAMRVGLYLGELKKNRFEPSQALAMSLTAGEYRHVADFSPDDERLLKYLKGETLETGDAACGMPKNWYLITVDGYPLGWGKTDHGILKNKYLPGWRMQ